MNQRLSTIFYPCNSYYARILQLINILTNNILRKCLAKVLKKSTGQILGKQNDLFLICAFAAQCSNFNKTVKNIIAKCE